MICSVKCEGGSKGNHLRQEGTPKKVFCRDGKWGDRKGNVEYVNPNKDFGCNSP